MKIIWKKVILIICKWNDKWNKYVNDIKWINDRKW